MADMTEEELKRFWKEHGYTPEEEEPSLLEQLGRLPYQVWVLLGLLICSLFLMLILPLTAFLFFLAIVLFIAGAVAYAVYRAPKDYEYMERIRPVYDLVDRLFHLSDKYESWAIVRAYEEQRRAFEKALHDIKPLTFEERQLLINAVAQCEWPGCGVGAELDVHYITPRYAGGTNALENLIVLCPKHREEATEVRKAKLEEITRNKTNRFREPIWSKWKW